MRSYNLTCRQLAVCKEIITHQLEIAAFTLSWDFDLLCLYVKKHTNFPKLFRFLIVVYMANSASKQIKLNAVL